VVGTRERGEWRLDRLEVEIGATGERFPIETGGPPPPAEPAPPLEAPDPEPEPDAGPVI
jgi:hypothetical protein